MSHIYGTCNGDLQIIFNALVWMNPLLPNVSVGYAMISLTFPYAGSVFMLTSEQISPSNAPFLETVSAATWLLLQEPKLGEMEHSHTGCSGAL